MEFSTTLGTKVINNLQLVDQHSMVIQGTQYKVDGEVSSAYKYDHGFYITIIQHIIIEFIIEIMMETQIKEVILMLTILVTKASLCQMVQTTTL